MMRSSLGSPAKASGSGSPNDSTNADYVLALTKSPD